MAYTIDSILNDPLITVIARDDEMGSFAIKIGTLKTIITIELGRYHTTETTKFKLSHAIHTPEQAGPYITSNPSGDYWEYALHRAINGLISYYKSAVNAGCQPKESWLKEV
ncbi:hypothetical protein [Acidocella facilis]|uniref:hypothetical protein n=1 Tax=Acidocella facilis TaxID=525 RepID=UPI001F4506AF|nr:hypothetical protein [Acidocella facilis]